MVESFEIYPDLPPHEVIDGLYEWSTSELGMPMAFGIYNKKILIDYEHLKEEILRNHEWNVSEVDIIRYTRAGLLPELRLDDGSIGFPLYTSTRIRFIKELENKWGYDSIKLKVIADYEEMLIDDVYTAEDLDYSDLPTLDFFVACAKERIDGDKAMLEYCKTPAAKEHLLNRINKTEDMINSLQGISFEDLPEMTQKRIDKAVFQIKWASEFSRLVGISEYQSNILCGFSPDAWIKTSASRGMNEPFTDESEYLYSYCDKSLERLYLWGDWDYHNATRLGFFATPDFIIDRQGDNIYLNIRDPHRVDARYMRRIEKIYCEFRNKLELPKTGWGAKKGTKRKIAKRDARLRDIYRMLREEKPMSAASRLLRLAAQMVASEFGEQLSIETAKRIIYTKEKLTNSSAKD